MPSGIRSSDSGCCPLQPCSVPLGGGRGGAMGMSQRPAFELDSDPHVRQLRCLAAVLLLFHRHTRPTVANVFSNRTVLQGLGVEGIQATSMSFVELEEPQKECSTMQDRRGLHLPLGIFGSRDGSRRV